MNTSILVADALPSSRRRKGVARRSSGVPVVGEAATDESAISPQLARVRTLSSWTQTCHVPSMDSR